MKICTVGSGRMAAAHSRALGRLPDVELHTVVDPDVEYAETLERDFGYQRVAPSLDEALAADGFDAVVVCTPNPLHAPQSAAALRAGKHVLCEIPMALSLSDAEELGRLAEENDLRFMVCHTNRFKSGRIELRRRIADGDFHPQKLIGRFHMLRRGQLTTDRARYGWDDNALWHHGCHVIDSVMDIVGSHKPKGLSVQFGPPWPSLGVPLDVDLQWSATSPITGEDVLVSISISHNDHWGSHEYRIAGVEDTFLVQDARLSNQHGVIVEGDSEQDGVNLQDAEFVAAVNEGRSPAVDVTTALPTIEVLQAAWDAWVPRPQ